MIEIEIDGRKVSVPQGGTVMDAANAAGIFVPHFCYHRKLSIAANCRMCLVEVEKAPKPLPACATPATPGMIVRTASERARQAQRSVMEFLLINHPLDCPICDQGGECQLQDLAVGYGGSASRYREEKRVVVHKQIGPLVSAEEMARCIHCTRCVRFGQEIAGVMELGMAGHGEHAEILTFVGRSVDSELSGNMIDVCPVGALTSKPFRYRARTWELARRRSISPHDSLGSNLVLQLKQREVVRVVPLENEAVNECWISDRDRFSYEGLAAERLTRPMIRRDGVLREVTWPEALEYTANLLERVRDAHGGAAIGALAAGGSTAEELHLLGKVVRGLGSESIDFRVRQSDFRADAVRRGAPWLGMPVAEINGLDRLLLVGSFLRQDHPLLAARVRKAAGAGARVHVLHAADENLLLRPAGKCIAAPSQWVGALARLAVAVARARSLPDPVAGVEPDAWAAAAAQDLCSGERVALLAGNAAVQHPDAARIQAWMQWIAEAVGGRFGVIGEAANSVGGYLAGATPGPDGRNARTMFEAPMAGYLLWGLEPELDCADPAQARRALQGAEAVVAFSAYRSDALLEIAHAVLPIATFAETAGTFVNCEGRAQSFQGVTVPPGEARPGWKVLRVLADQFGIDGFGYDTPEEVRADALPIQARMPLDSGFHSGLAGGDLPAGSGGEAPEGAAERLADVPLYFTDAIVRRAEALQKTVQARAPQVRANAATLARFGVEPGAAVRVRQGGATAVLPCAVDAALADGVVRVSAGHADTAGLGPMFGPIHLECA